MEYDRTKLIPEVTRLLNMSADGLNDERCPKARRSFASTGGTFLPSAALSRVSSDQPFLCVPKT